MKIGRNQPCPCGSGKKYKKCHLFSGIPLLNTAKVTKIEPTPEINSIRAELEKQMEERRQKLVQVGIFIDFVIPTHFKGNKVWALGSRVYPRRPEKETFHEFIVFVLKEAMGRDWWIEQMNLPEEKQHFIYKCFMKHYEWQDKNMTPENAYGQGWRAVPDGYSRALTSLAFDVCSLIHAVHLPEIFIKKLRTYEGYQSVRYEIAVAAMFARMGYKIKFFDEEFTGPNQPKHSEFSATNPKNNEEIIVEVKSKEREGVLHIEGEFNKEKEFRSSVGKLYRHALKQKQAGKPFIVFIDMNLPLSPPDAKPEEVPWVKAVTKMRDEATFSTKGKPLATNAILFTNYSYHYGTDQETGSGEWLMEKSGNPEITIKSPDFGEKFLAVIHRYGNVPNLDMTIES